MNYGIILYMLGWILKIEGIFMALPLATAVIYGEMEEGLCYLGVALVCLILGFLGTMKKPKTRMFFAKEGFVSVSLGWLVLSIFGCAPFILTGEIPHFIDAMFEIVSGFTTTGSSIVPRWRICPTPPVCGAASPTGSEAWESWCSSWPSSRWQAIIICISCGRRVLAPLWENLSPRSA